MPGTTNSTLRWALPLLISAVVATGASLGHAAATEPRPGTRSAELVIAIGDSYLSGIGAGEYRIEDNCRRSSRSPAALLARDRGATLVDLSCPGAQVKDASRQATRVTVDTDVVLVQIGGNDLGFVGLAVACLLGSQARCREESLAADGRVTALEANLVGLVRQIRLHTPAARVLLLGYPSLIHGPRCTSLLTAPRVRDITRVQSALDGVLTRAARRTGAVFVDWPRVVDRHSLCSADPWFALPGQRWDDLLHPDVRASRAMSQRLMRALAP